MTIVLNEVSAKGLWIIIGFSVVCWALLEVALRLEERKLNKQKGDTHD